MASVTSLDGDLRKLRLDKYTPAAANEARSWIEGVLGTRLPGSDLLEGLKDGVALCKLINLAVGPPGVKYKQSAMPFVQMENISQFLRACQSPPLNLQEHDMFLTVDLYEQKDPAQVLQCIGAFSRAANSINPSAFPDPIGPKSRSHVVSPQSTGPASARARAMSNLSNSSHGQGRAAATLSPHKTGESNSGRWSPTKSPAKSPAKSPTGSDRMGARSPNVSSWSKKDHEGITSPAWNIAQYGYMGGASQGNLGISFGGRRQITSAGPHVPSLAEKERLRKVKAAEEERQKQQMEEEERIRKAEAQAEERRAREEEERRWEEETRKLRAEEKRKADEEKRKWEEEERQWKLTEEKRRKEEAAAEAQLAEERKRARSRSNSKLHGQFLSQYQAEHGVTPENPSDGYSDRVKELEKELELARQREREYEQERARRGRKTSDTRPRDRSRSRPRSRPPSRPPSRMDSWSHNEREVLQTQWSRHQEAIGAGNPAQSIPARPLPEPTASPVMTHRTGEGRPLPIPDRLKNQPGANLNPGPSNHGTPAKSPASTAGIATRPLPNPKPVVSPPNANRTDRFLASHPAPVEQKPQQTWSRELGGNAEQDGEDRRRAQSQAKTKAGGWASKSLLEREMERERERQREWEQAQKETAKATRPGDGVDGIGGGIGGRWDVSQWAGYTGGDNQNKGGAGIGAGRRQIVGPRPLPNRP